MRDYLGSVRTVLDITRDTSEVNDPALAILEQNDYLPFGTRIDLDSLAYDQSNRYRFNGKEEQTTGGIGLTDYGARYYDSQLPRWTTPDPLAEKYYSISPYAFCNNNPVNFVDPDGRQIQFFEMAAYSGSIPNLYTIMKLAIIALLVIITRKVIWLAMEQLVMDAWNM